MIFSEMTLYDVWTFVCACLVVAFVCAMVFEGAVILAERGLDRRPQQRDRVAESEHAAAVH